MNVSQLVKLCKRLQSVGEGDLVAIYRHLFDLVCSRLKDMPSIRSNSLRHIAANIAEIIQVQSTVVDWYVDGYLPEIYNEEVFVLFKLDLYPNWSRQSQ